MFGFVGGGFEPKPDEKVFRLGDVTVGDGAHMTDAGLSGTVEHQPGAFVAEQRKVPDPRPIGGKAQMVAGRREIDAAARKRQPVVIHQGEPDEIFVGDLGILEFAEHGQMPCPQLHDLHGRSCSSMCRIAALTVAKVGVSTRMISLGSVSKMPSKD